MNLPSVGDLKGLDPKRLALEHGEKLVVLVCLLLFVVGLVRLTGGVVVGTDTGRKLKDETANLDKNLGGDARKLPEEDPVGDLKRWEVPLPQSDPWRIQVVDERIALLPPGTIQKIPRAPDVARKVQVAIYSVDPAYGWVLTGARPDPAIVKQFLLGLARRDQIPVEDLTADAQWAVIHGWFDMRAIVEDMSGLLKGAEETLRKAAAERRQGARAAGGPAQPWWRLLGPQGGQPGGPEEQLPIWMPRFAGLEVLREDLARPGQWEAVQVSDPVGPEERERVLPTPPPGWPLDQPWPPPRISPWQGGTAGMNSVIRRDPYAAMEGRVKVVPPPPFFLRQRVALPGGVFLDPDAKRTAELVMTAIREYLAARDNLDKVKPTDPGFDLHRQGVWNRVVEREHGLGLRFVDTTVLPGHRYRYRMRVLIENPCAGLPEELTVPSARAPAVLKSAFSAPSQMVLIPANVEFWLKTASPSGPTGVVDRAGVEIHALYRGIWRVKETLVRTGDRIAYRGPLEVLKLMPRPNTAGAGGVGTGGPAGRPTPMEMQVGTETVTLDTGAVLLDLIPVQVLRPIYATRSVTDPVTQKSINVRDFLAPVNFLEERRHRMVYLDGSGVVGSGLQGDIPPRAVKRRQDYTDWLKSGLREFRPIEPGGEMGPPLWPEAGPRWEEPPPMEEEPPSDWRRED